MAKPDETFCSYQTSDLHLHLFFSCHLFPYFPLSNHTPDGIKTTHLDELLLNGSTVVMLVPGGDGQLEKKA